MQTPALSAMPKRSGLAPPDRNRHATSARPKTTLPLQKRDKDRARLVCRRRLISGERALVLPALLQVTADYQTLLSRSFYYRSRGQSIGSSNEKLPRDWPGSV